MSLRVVTNLIWLYPNRARQSYQSMLFKGIYLQDFLRDSQRWAPKELFSKAQRWAPK